MRAIARHPDYPEFSLRPWAWWRDAVFSYRLANDPEIRRQSFDRRRPTLSRHIGWCWRRARRSPYWSRTYVLVSSRLGQVGQLRYDWNAERLEWVVGIALLPSCRGRGLGQWMLSRELPASGECWPVLAEIRRDNVASLRAFEAAGYLKDDDRSDDFVVRMLR